MVNLTDLALLLVAFSNLVTLTVVMAVSKELDKLKRRVG